MKSQLTLVFAFVASVLPASAQRPRSVDEAVLNFDKVREQAERTRYRAVRDLGRFAGDEATALLLQELERAQTISYRQTVVRAIGREVRTGVVLPLQEVLLSADNPRLADSAADAMARQGTEGVAALAARLPSAKGKSVQRNAICYALGRVDDERVRDVLLVEVGRAGGRDRLPPLRGLHKWRGDAAVDDMRRQLAGDKDPRVAATALEQLAEHDHPDAASLAVELSRRLGPEHTSDLHAAVLDGLLTRPAAAHYDALLTAAAFAEDPFGEQRRASWSRAFEQADFVKWLGSEGATRKTIGERCAAARALALAPEPQHERALAAAEKLVRQRDAAVVQAAATALVTLGGAPAKAALTALAAKGHADTVAIALGGLHELRRAEPEWRDELLQCTAHRQPAARTAALRALATLTPPDERLLTAAGKNLGNKDWRVRAAAIELAVASRSAKAPPLLFARLDKEKARLRQDVAEALWELTGLQFPTTAGWQKWWAREGASFQPLAQKQPNQRQPDRREATGVSYWNIPVRSDRVTFVVDVSGSMSQPFGTGNDTRLDEARRQLQRVFDRLPKKALTNVITFAAAGDALFESLQSLDKKRRKLADTFVGELAAKGPTNVHGALQLAFADREVDTIFLLTDGRPSVGAIVAPEPLAAEVARWNLGRGVRIHTVAIGARSEFLERLAEESGGEHTVAR